jgi:hypothetical protein
MLIEVVIEDQCTFWSCIRLESLRESFADLQERERKLFGPVLLIG